MTDPGEHAAPDPPGPGPKDDDSSRGVEGAHLAGDPDEIGTARLSAPQQKLGLWWLGVAGLLVAGTLMVSQNLRAYGYAVGATLGFLGLLRAVLPADKAGALVVRSRVMDVATLLVLGAAIAALASTLRLG